jgi:hypothetical protein
VGMVQKHGFHAHLSHTLLGVYYHTKQSGPSGLQRMEEGVSLHPYTDPVILATLPRLLSMEIYL